MGSGKRSRHGNGNDINGMGGNGSGKSHSRTPLRLQLLTRLELLSDDESFHGTATSQHHQNVYSMCLTLLIVVTN